MPAKITTMLMLLLGMMVTLGGHPRQDTSSDHSDSAELKRAWLVLDELHHAASIANGGRYFAVFAPDAVFLGTDATERWTLAEFKAYAQQRFDQGTGWTYALVKDSRHITIAEGGMIAWFDELLDNAKYGRCRGSGVLRKIGNDWRVAQYNLAFMIPNDVAKDVVALVKAKQREQ